MDVYVQGKRRVSLNPADFKAQGGEGAVYVKGQTAYKVYADPAKMIPLAKIGELAALTRPEIIRPQDVLLDKNQTPIGYTMAHAADTVPLCQTFTRAFRDRAHLTPDLMLRLVRVLQEGVQHVHSKQILIVDLNETNFLVDTAFRQVYFIDVDSYQTPSFRATALMDSVRDRHASGFCEDTDWFAFAIVSFQMFVGIHPYKGKHATLKTLDERMQANVSALAGSVSVPAACLPFDVIPQVYRDWYGAVFERGRRCPPPDRLDGIVRLAAPPPPRGVLSQMFQIEELEQFGGEIVNFLCGLVVTTEGVMSGRTVALAQNAQVGIAPGSGHAVAAWIEHGRVRGYDLNRKQNLQIEIAAEALMATEGRLYVKQVGSVSEIEFLEQPLSLWVTAKHVANVMDQATQLFPGVAFQDMLGACYATLFPKRGRSYQIRISELDGAQIIDAAFQKSVLMILAVKEGRYEKCILRFDDGYQSYDLRHAENITPVGINFVVLDSGVCLHLNENDELELFSQRKDAIGIKIIADPAIQGDCKLFRNGTQALFARSKTLYKFAMRKG